MPRAERPLDAGDSPLLRMAADLRKLRAEAGSPAYRELSKRAHYSTGALSDAAAGRRLPTLAVTLAYVRACGGDVEQWTRRWHEVAAGWDTADPVPDKETAAPYVGLAAFQSADAERFFGRERLAAELCARVAEHRFVMVVGPSGSGKSSLLRAGLVHHARPGGALGPSTTMVLTPGPHPLQECAAQLAGLVDCTAVDVHAALRADPLNLHLLVLQAVPDQSELLVVVDQFEEMFTLCRDDDERGRFVSALVAAAQAANSRIRIAAGVRADFYAHCARYPALVEVLRQAQVLVGPMTTEELRSAITQPAVQVGCRVENALVSTLVADATGQPGVLPLVSHALLETWRRRRGTVLTLAGYQAAGGISAAIARTAEAVYAELSANQQEWARQLFSRLVTPGEGTEDTRRRLDRTELDLDDAEAAVVLERLAKARLVTLDHDSVQIAHEALIRCWPRLRDWLDQDRERLRHHRQLTEAAVVWESLAHDAGALYRGTRLDQARELADAPLTARERAFLDASLAAATAERATADRRVHRRRLLVAALVVLLAITTGTTVFAVRANDTIGRQRDTALSEKAAADAVALRRTDPALAAQLSLAAYRLSPGPSTRDGLISTMAVPVEGHDQVVSAVAFSPDGRLLVTGSFDHTARLWDVSDRRHPVQLSTLATHTDLVATAAFGPDGRLLATAGRDNTVRLWNITDPRHPVQLSVLTGHTDSVYSVAFSPDEHALATGSYDRTARLWDITDPGRVVAAGVLTTHTLSVKPVAFGPAGHLLATGSDDRTVRLWNVADIRHPTPVAVIADHTDLISALAFSPDGRTLATGSNDHTVRLWNVTDAQHPARLAVLTGHTDIVSSVAFSPDGRTLASGDYDHSARLWDISAPERPTAAAVLVGHAGAVNTVAFSPDGRTLATGSDDHTAQLWDTDIGADRVEAQACQLARPTISPADWERHFPGLSYAPPCPE